MKLIIVIRYDFDETKDNPIAEHMADLDRRLDHIGPGTAWVAIGEPCERVSAAVEAEEAR